MVKKIVTSLVILLLLVSIFIPVLKATSEVEWIAIPPSYSQVYDNDGDGYMDSHKVQVDADTQHDTGSGSITVHVRARMYDRYDNTPLTNEIQVDWQIRAPGHVNDGELGPEMHFRIPNGYAPKEAGLSHIRTKTLVYLYDDEWHLEMNDEPGYGGEYGPWEIRHNLYPPGGLQYPVAQLSASPMEPVVGQTVTFDGSASYDPDGSIVAYRFFFGDGSDSGWISQPTYTHEYSTIGYRNAQLSVRDNDGQEDSLDSDLVLHVVDAPDGDITDIRFPDHDPDPQYYRGNIVEFWVDVYNPTSTEWHYLVRSYILNPSDTKVYDSNDLGANRDAWVQGKTDAYVFLFTWIIPSDAPTGTYRVIAELRQYPWDPLLDSREETFVVKDGPTADTGILLGIRYFGLDAHDDNSDYFYDGVEASFVFDISGDVVLTVQGRLFDPNGRQALYQEVTWEIDYSWEKDKWWDFDLGVPSDSPPGKYSVEFLVEDQEGNQKQVSGSLDPLCPPNVQRYLDIPSRRYEGYEKLWQSWRDPQDAFIAYMIGYFRDAITSALFGEFFELFIPNSVKDIVSLIEKVYDLATVSEQWAEEKGMVDATVAAHQDFELFYGMRGYYGLERTWNEDPSLVDKLQSLYETEGFYSRIPRIAEPDFIGNELMFMSYLTQQESLASHNGDIVGQRYYRLRQISFIPHLEWIFTMCENISPTQAPEYWNTIICVTLNTLQSDVYYLKLAKEAVIGDLRTDGKINILDVLPIAKAFGSRLGESRYDPTADVDGDGRVSILDVMPMAHSFGKKWWT